MADESTADQTETGEPRGDAASARRLDPQPIALAVGVAAMLVGTAASASWPAAGVLAAAAMAGLTFYLPHGTLDDDAEG